MVWVGAFTGRVVVAMVWLVVLVVVRVGVILRILVIQERVIFLGRMGEGVCDADVG
jgi:hypothetical protein